MKIKYEYTKDLQNRIFVESAEHVTGATIDVTEAQLSPAARADMLIALCGRRYSGCGERYPILSADSDVRHDVSSAANQWIGLQWIEWPEPVNAIPDVAQAVLDVERTLRIAAAAAPAVLARIECEKASAERHQAEATEAAIVARIAAGPILEGECTKGNRRANTYAMRRDLPADPRIEALVAQAEALAAAETAAHEEEQHMRGLEWRVAIDKFVAEHATDLSPRHTDGFLPETELLGRIRDHVFGTIDAPRYQKIRGSEITHCDECRDHEERPTYKFSVDNATELTATQYEALTRIREMVSDDVTVQARCHTGYCTTDGCDDVIVRHSALVTVEWGGRRLSREYAL